jgi:hypothetical protein
LILSICGALSGCGAHFNSIYRSDDLDRQDRLMTTDAQQRVILRGNRVGTDGEIVTCVEPHPDAFTVNAASAAGNFTAPNGLGAALSGASSQSGASLALRTQTNTILREQGYRICESYINGAVSKVDYAQLLRRNQVMVTAVLAIEQLTGAVVGPSFAIGASSSVEIDKDAVQAANAELAKQQTAEGTQQGVVDSKKTAVAQQEAEVEKQRKAHEDAKKAQTELLARPTPPATETEKTDAANKVSATLTARDTAIKERDTRKQSLEAEEGKLKGYQDAVLTARRNVTQASNPDLQTGTSSNVHGPAIVSKDVPGVALAVQHIVDLAFSKQYILDLCQMYWTNNLPSGIDSGNVSKENKYPNLGQVCSAVLDKWLALMDADAKKDTTGATTLSPYTLFSEPVRSRM